ncbi:MAG: TonB family protein [Bacteroidales bacterium]|nr:TonB family protein [Bacteroidales bacterium]
MTFYRRFTLTLTCIIAGGFSVLLAQELKYTAAPQSASTYADSVKAKVLYFCSPSLKGRMAGTNEEKITSKYIYDYLQSVGVMMLSTDEGDDFGLADPNGGDTLRSRNIVGIIPGYDPVLKGEYVLIGTHYDGPGYENITVDGRREERIFPGAYDNAAATASLMQIAKMVSENKFMFRRSVIVAFFGAGRLASAGSWYFINRSFADKDKITFMIDINCIGREDNINKFQAFTGVGNKRVIQEVLSASERPFSIVPEIAELEPVASDYRNFYSAGIPVTLFSSGDNNQRGTIHDTPNMLDYLTLGRICEYIYTYANQIANLKDKIGAEAPLEVTPSGERIYSQQEVEKRAAYFRGDERSFLRDYVYNYVKYPDSAIAQGIEGTEIAEFVVDEKGKVKDIKITKSLSDDIDKEVIKVLKGSPKWVPAEIGGEKVSVRISLAIEFILTKKSTIGIKK